MKWILPVLLLIANISYAQLNKALPYIYNYSPREYEQGTDNWAAAQDKRGIMYFGNVRGVLEFDGTRWKLIPLSNSSIARSIAVDSSGVVYVGGVGDFGYLKPDKNGELHYFSLMDELTGKEREFGDVWKTYATPDGIYFQTFNRLFRWKDGKLKTWEPPASFHLSYFINSTLFILDKETGLMQIANDSLVSAPNGGFFAEDRIYTMLDYSPNKVILAMRDKDFLIYDFKTGTVTPHPTEADEYCMQNYVSNGTKINDTTYAIATLRGGLVILTQSGKLVRLINKQTQLQDDNVKYVFKDNGDGLWLALDNGISRVETSSPIGFYNDISGLKGSVTSVSKFNSRLYVGTTQGVFYQLPAETNVSITNPELASQLIKSFSPVPPLSSTAWQFLNFKIPGSNTEKLIAATTEGLFEIKNSSADLIAEVYAFSACQSKTDSSRVFIGMVDGVASLKMEKDKWVEENIFPEFSKEVRYIVEDKKGDLWLTVPFEGVYRFRFNTQNGKTFTSPYGKEYSVELYDTTKGFTDVSQNFVFEAGGKIVVGTQTGIYAFNEKDNHFYPDNSFGSELSDGSRQVFYLAEETPQSFWISAANTESKQVGNLTQQNGAFKNWVTAPFKRFYESEIHTIYPAKDNVIWFGGPEGLISYNMNYKHKPSLTFNTLIRKVTTANDSLLFAGNYLTETNDYFSYSTLTQPKNFIPEIDYESNSLTFYFSATAFDNAPSNRFSWMLEGYDKAWSAFSNETKTKYTNLPEGKYTFKVIGQDVYGNTSKEAIYQFKISPPWYRTTLAYILGLLLIIGIIYLIIQLSILRLKRAKIHLEKVVNERTAEVVLQKHEIEKQKDLLEEKNKDITDSINYASRIQQAILPMVEEIKEVLPQSFVLFKPRDIVSGDFYWFHKKNDDIYLAAADCTGHGVPGAFMSMIGYTLLNEILNEKKITDPGQMLDELHVQVRYALKQDQVENRDGMDIALCKLNIKTNVLEYAGANRPLYTISNNSLTETKATKSPIGGLQGEEARKFEKHSIQLKPGDSFYIFSDGYADQFGGTDGKKFMVKRLKELLLEMTNIPVDKQADRLNENIENWMAHTEQIDDILIVGVKV